MFRVDNRGHSQRSTLIRSSSITNHSIAYSFCSEFQPIFYNMHEHILLENRVQSKQIQNIFFSCKLLFILPKKSNQYWIIIRIYVLSSYIIQLYLKHFTRFTISNRIVFILLHVFGVQQYLLLRIVQTNKLPANIWWPDYDA